MWEQVRSNDVYLSVYSQAHYRAPGYLIGVLAGYAVFRRRTTDLTKVCRKLKTHTSLIEMHPAYICNRETYFKKKLIELLMRKTGI